MRAAAVSLLIVLAAPTALARQTHVDQGDLVDAALLSRGIELGQPRSDVIGSWNSLAHDIAFAEDQFLTFKGQRALAMMHLAMHDALNAIVPVYESYAFGGGPRLAHPIAASAQAAHDVLLSQYPGRQQALADQLNRWLAQVPAGVLRDHGIELGKATAAAVLARRDGDGWNGQVTYEFGEGPGRYQTTPPWNGFVAWPGFRFAKPFVLEYPHQFRPSPPPPCGQRPTPARSAKSRNTAPPPARVGRTIRPLMRSGGWSSQKGRSIAWRGSSPATGTCISGRRPGCSRTSAWHSTTRMSRRGTRNTRTITGVPTPPFALPTRTATRKRHRTPTGNRCVRRRHFPDTRRLTRPPVPPRSACWTEAFGRNVTFTMETTTAPPGMPTRTFESFSAAAVECADSRVRLGWHFRYATDAGLVLGQRIAGYLSSHALQVRSRRDGRKNQ